MTFEEFKAAGYYINRVVPTSEVQHLNMDSINSFEEANDCDNYDVQDSYVEPEDKIEYDVYTSDGRNLNLGIPIIGTKQLKCFIEQF
ncbi:hypothetical protein FOD75_11475 (plasmid) [Limosilactobacillus reuteri]|uniref:Uncharacterized protein n=1 Tax=Limosilactobacillus reuteri TaxID=1598 RepID=A0A517D8L5_LIMRT|nr:hypothetical protein [Limosilactobacillus reuteri]QDR73703.1 hypothetical protein FOD75_11475 [Limosilactobacillus reuteri]